MIAHTYPHYRPQTKLREGNVFTPVCDSVPGEGGTCGEGDMWWVKRGCMVKGHALWRGVHGERGGGVCNRDGHWSRRYAPYWNAFLFREVFFSCWSQFHPFCISGTCLAHLYSSCCSGWEAAKETKVCFSKFQLNDTYFWPDQRSKDVVYERPKSRPFDLLTQFELIRSYCSKRDTGCLLLDYRS